MNTDKLGGRKFVLSLISFVFVLAIFIVMLIKSWLTATYCMQFLTYLPIILGIFAAGNTAEKYIKRKKNDA